MRIFFALALALALACASAIYDDNNFPQTDPDRYIVKFAGLADLGKSEVQRLGGRILLDLPSINAAAAHIPRSAIQQLANSTLVEFVERDPPRWPMGGSKVNSTAGPQVTPYGITMVQADQIPNGAQQSAVCIIDSGWDAAHEDLQGIPLSGDGSADWNVDKCGHGTHVGGTVAAVDNTIGVIGVAQNLQIKIVKVFGNDCAWSYASNLISAAQVCLDRPQVTISMSLGCSSVIDAACRSTAEDQFFTKTFNEGHLSVAAAGNGGNTQNSWPASYEGVISVAAVDSTQSWATFSQRNNYVEIAAPGVNVYSTYPMGMGKSTTFSVNGVSYSAESLDGAPNAKGSGPLVNCGLGTTTCAGAHGAVCLIQRGDISFADKVLNCQNSGGVGAVIYNNVPGNFLGTLNGVATLIPSASLSQADGQTLLNAVGLAAALDIQVDNYAYLDGTSMSTPHVSGVLAKVWSNNKGWTNQQLRTTMQNTAKYCNGQTGKNVQCGFGIIQGESLYNAMKTKYGL